MDERVRDYLEGDLELSLSSFPEEGVLFHGCEAYPFQLVRVGGGAVFSGRSEVIQLLRPTVESLTLWELFSAFGLEELRRASEPHGLKPQGGSFHYTLTDSADLREDGGGGMVTSLLPPGFGPDPATFDKEFVAAFCVNVGGHPISTAGIRWKSDSFVEIEVETDQEHRGKGNGLSVVYAATDWILMHGAAAHYAVHPTNTPSMRIVRRLGYELTWQEIYAG